jgi:hypothetical protein
MARIDIKSSSTGGGGGSGTVTSVAIATGTTGTDVNATGTVTTSGTLTVNVPIASATKTGKLSSTDWTTFNGKGNGTVTSVAALTLGTTGTDLSSTVATGTTTPVITLNVPTASAANRGAVSSTDWSTFNAKQDALVSGTNIKTVNGTTILGSGDLNTGNLNGGTLVNFVANLASTSVNLTLNSGNTATYNGSVITTTGTITITLDASLPNGFSITVIQLNAGTTTIAGTGGLVIANRQSQTNNNGQYSVVSVIKITNVLAVLGGDTA